MKLPLNSASRLPGPSGNQLEKVHGKSEERYSLNGWLPSAAYFGWATFSLLAKIDTRLPFVPRWPANEVCGADEEVFVS
jgi:hypothetical protein